ncbi:MAG: hypothetical protein AAF518_06860 [Spirochaetota bacterium]
MEEQIKLLFETGETANLKIGMQILKASRRPRALLSYILAIYLFHTQKQFRLAARNIFVKYASSSLRSYVTTFWNWRYRNLTKESTLKTYLERLTSTPEIQTNEFANMVFRLTGKGAAFCLEYNTMQQEELLSLLVFDTSLSLQDFGLKAFPEGITNLTFLTHLNLSGNKFASLPESIQNLKKLEYLHLYRTSLNFPQRKQLQRLLPLVYATQKLNAGKSLDSKEKDKKLRLYSQALRIYPKFAKALIEKADFHSELEEYEFAKIEYQKALQLQPQDAHIHSCFAEAICRLGQYQETLVFCEKALQNFSNFVKKDSVDKFNLYFFKGLAHFYLQQYENALQANDASLQIQNYPGAWYNKACSYSKLSKKKEMLLSLEKALQILPQEYYHMAVRDEDKDFQPYWNDTNFQQLLQKYQQES